MFDEGVGPCGEFVLGAVAHVQRGLRASRQDPLVVHAVAVVEHRAQGLVPVDDSGQRVTQRVDVQRTAHAEHERIVVRRPGLAETIEHQHAPLCG